MIERSFAELVTDLHMRRTVGDKPPVLLLGAGASIDAGIGAMPELFEFFGCADFEAFCEYIDTTTAAERYRYLAESIRMHPGQEELKALMQRQGFGHVDFHNMTGGVVALHVGVKC